MLPTSWLEAIPLAAGSLVEGAKFHRPPPRTWETRGRSSSLPGSAIVAEIHRSTNPEKDSSTAPLPSDVVRDTYLYFIPVWDDYMQIAAAKLGASWARLPSSLACFGHHRQQPPTLEHNCYFASFDTTIACIL